MSQSSDFPPASKSLDRPSDPSGGDARGLRAAGKARSRSSLLTAAKDLFVRHGYEGATMRQIAAAAGLSTGAVFASFSDKADLFNAVLTDDAEVQAEMMAAASAEPGPVAQRLLRVMAIGYDFHLGQLELLRAGIALSWSKGLPGELGDRPVREVVVTSITRLLNEAAQQGELKPRTDISLVADTLWDCYVANYRCAVFAGFDAARLKRRLGDQIALLLAGQLAS